MTLTPNFTFQTNNESVFILYNSKTPKIKKIIDNPQKLATKYTNDSTVSDKGGISRENELTAAVDSIRLPAEY